MTRQNVVVSSDRRSMTQALIPLWDMCNHADGKLSTDYNLELDRSECLSWCPVPKGSQVFIFYGARPNCDLLVHNGFVYPSSKHDAVRVRLGVARADPLHADKVALLEKVGLPPACDLDVCAGPRPVSAKLLAFLRVFNMDKDQLKHWSEATNVADLLEEDCDPGVTLTSKVWMFLATRIKLLLHAYPTKKEDDEKLLSDGDAKLTPNARLAVQLRLEEKRLLESALSFAEARMHA